MLTRTNIVLTLLVPGAGQVADGRWAWLGWLLGLGWSLGWSVFLLATWVVPRNFPDWAPAVGAAVGLAAWPVGLLSLALAGELAVAADAAQPLPPPTTDRRTQQEPSFPPGPFDPED